MQTASTTFAARPRHRVLVVLACCSGTRAPIGRRHERSLPPERDRLSPLPVAAVNIHDSFWAPRLEVNRTRTLDHVLQEIEGTGGLRNFDIAAGKATGKFGGPFWADSDVYKWIEGASWTLATHPDPGARREAGRHHRPHRRRAAARRLSRHLRSDQRARPAVQELRVLPRGLLVRPPVRGGRGALSGDRQEDAPHRRDAAGRSVRSRVRSRQEGLHLGPRGHRAGAGQAVARDG